MPPRDGAVASAALGESPRIAARPPLPFPAARHPCCRYRVRYHGEGIPSEDGGNAVLRAEDRLDVVEETPTFTLPLSRRPSLFPASDRSGGAISAGRELVRLELVRTLDASRPEGCHGGHLSYLLPMADRRQAPRETAPEAAGARGVARGGVEPPTP